MAEIGGEMAEIGGEMAEISGMAFFHILRFQFLRRVSSDSASVAGVFSSLADFAAVP